MAVGTVLGVTVGTAVTAFTVVLGTGLVAFGTTLAYAAFRVFGTEVAPEKQEGKARIGETKETATHAQVIRGPWQGSKRGYGGVR